MIKLYESGGAGDFSLVQAPLSHDKCMVLFENAARLLAARNQVQAAKFLRSAPFRVETATNHCNDDFYILHAIIPLKEYESFRLAQQDQADRQAFGQIAAVLRELGTSVRFIAVELTLERPVHPETLAGRGLKASEINKLTYRYIGVSGGYLGDFSYRSHHDFYIELDLDINPNNYDGTTRERFIKILSESSPQAQARILEGILSRFPVDSSQARAEMAAEIRGWIVSLRSGYVEQPVLRITSEVVERALRDAQELIKSTGATSGVDRLHTALHGYLQQICAREGLNVSGEASLTDLFKAIREKHPAFNDLGPRSEDIIRVLKALATILDSFNPLRNKASVAHPNPTLLQEAEAMLVINVSRSILNYVDKKVYWHQSSGHGSVENETNGG